MMYIIILYFYLSTANGPATIIMQIDVSQVYVQVIEDAPTTFNILVCRHLVHREWIYILCGI